MKIGQIIQALAQFDAQGSYVFSTKNLKKIFQVANEKTLAASLNRLVNNNILIRACRGVYVNPLARSFDSYVIEHIAKVLRRGVYNYVSLESSLIEYGAISQIMIDRLTVMTTGRKGLYKTPYGIIEFTHTKRPLSQLLDSMKTIPNRPLRVATKQAAWRDLKRVGRNVNMVILSEVYEE